MNKKVKHAFFICVVFIIILKVLKKKVPEKFRIYETKYKKVLKIYNERCRLNNYLSHAVPKTI